jgi:hypothetical protein
VKEREHALQSLDLSYHKYKEIVRHLDDGIQVRFCYGSYLRRVLERLFLIVLQRPDGVVDSVQRKLCRMGDGPTVRAKVNQQFSFACHF